MREFTIYHNPDCGTSRNVLAMLRKSGIEPVVVEYLKTPPDRATLVSLIASMGMPARGLLRVKGTPYGELGLDDPKWTDDELVGAMIEHPILINRPIVVAPKGVRLCRPSDLVLELLPDPQLAFTKEEGVSALLSEPTVADDAPRDALAAAGLPVDDLDDPNLALLRFRLPAGDTVGYGGFERHGDAALLRSIVVLPAYRGSGIGRNLMLLLMRRAFDAGAQQGYALTTSADDWLEKLGFKRFDRAQVPEEILQTRQATQLYPSDARIWGRSLRP